MYKHFIKKKIYFCLLNIHFFKSIIFINLPFPFILHSYSFHISYSFFILISYSFFIFLSFYLSFFPIPYLSYFSIPSLSFFHIPSLSSFPFFYPPFQILPNSFSILSLSFMYTPL